MEYKDSKKIKKILTAITIIAIILAISFFVYTKLIIRENGYILKGNGRIEGREIAIATKFSGRITELKVDEGDTVKKGDLLAVIDSRSLAANIDAQKAKLIEIEKQILATEAEIKATESDIKFFTTEVKRTKTLMKQNFSSQLEMDRNTNNLEKSQARLLSLEANKNALEASYKSLEASIQAKEIDLGDMKIYSPSNGVILYKLAENGEMLGPNGRIFIMYNPDELYMTIYMPSEKAGKVKLGEKAFVKLDAYSNKTFPAKVTFVAENAEFTPKEVETQQERQKLVFRIKLTLEDNSNREAKPGMPGDGYVKLDSTKDWPNYLK